MSAFKKTLDHLLTVLQLSLFTPLPALPEKRGSYHFISTPRRRPAHLGAESDIRPLLAKESQLPLPLLPILAQTAPCCKVA